MIEKIRSINRFQNEMLLDLLTKLDSVEERGSTLLDNSMVLYGSAIADGNRHNHDDLPLILAGGGAGTLDPGRHVRYEGGTPLSNLFVSMLQQLGLEIDTFVSSTGTMRGLQST